MGSYLDDFMPIDSAYLDPYDPDFQFDDEFEYDEDGYVNECPNDRYAENLEE